MTKRMQRQLVLVTFCCFIMIINISGHSSGAANQNNKPSESSPKGPSCIGPGYPGIPGHHGTPGKDGRDGRDGRDGNLGKPGLQGVEGAQGKPGPAGASGPMGTKGMKGDTGEKGDSGPPGVTGMFSYSNWKECSWDAFAEGKDIGLIKDCVFQKKSSSSILHVYWNGNLRIYNCVGCCKRWYFTFNGAECISPRAIDGIAYIGQPGGQDLHRVRHIEGHCDGVSKGQIRVGFNVGNCASVKGGDAMTGWQSTSRLFVEEVDRPQQ